MLTLKAFEEFIFSINDLIGSLTSPFIPTPSKASMMISPSSNSLISLTLFLILSKFFLASKLFILSSSPARKTLTSAPSSSRYLAATKPSPPLLPRPQKTIIFKSFKRGLQDLIASTTALPAFSISSSLLTPKYSEFMSRTFTSSGVSMI